MLSSITVINSRSVLTECHTNRNVSVVSCFFVNITLLEVHVHVVNCYGSIMLYEGRVYKYRTMNTCIATIAWEPDEIFGKGGGKPKKVPTT